MCFRDFQLLTEIHLLLRKYKTSFGKQTKLTLNENQ